MFHVNAWGMPYCAAMVGATLVLPGRHLDGASLACAAEAERVTMTAGVPTVWLGLLAHLRSSGERLTTAQAHRWPAVPPAAAARRGIRDGYGVDVEHGWGMTETSPVGTYNAPKPAQRGADRRASACGMRLKQGRALSAST